MKNGNNFLDEETYIEMYMLSMKKFHGASLNIYDNSILREVYKSGFLSKKNSKNLKDEGFLEWDTYELNPDILDDVPYIGIDSREFQRLSSLSHLSCSLFYINESTSNPLKNYETLQKGKKYQNALIIWPQEDGKPFKCYWKFEHISHEFLQDIQHALPCKQELFPRDKFKNGISFLSNKILDQMENYGTLNWYFFPG
jgi:hypothetical protein